jgi:hypothetical protein
MNLHHQQIKVVGMNGQFSLGKEFAGKTVLIDQIDEATWVIKAGTFVPDSEKWLYHGKNLARLEKAMDWAEKTAPVDNFDQLVKGFRNE